MRPADPLEEGKCYFLLGYYDRDFKQPYIQTYIYLGKNLDGEQEDHWYFQDPASHAKAPKDSTYSDEQPGVIVVAEEGLDGFVDWQGLIENLTANLSMQGRGKRFDGPK